MSILLGQGFVPLTRDSCGALMSAVARVEFSAFETTLVLHEEAPFVVREFRRELTSARGRWRVGFVVRGICVARRG